MRGAVLNRTYGTDKNLRGICFALFTINIWSYLLWSPVILWRVDIFCAFRLWSCLQQLSFFQGRRDYKALLAAQKVCLRTTSIHGVYSYDDLPKMARLFFFFPYCFALFSVLSTLLLFLFFFSYFIPFCSVFPLRFPVRSLFFVRVLLFSIVVLVFSSFSIMFRL